MFVYAMVGVTVLSDADYFLTFRRQARRKLPAGL
jgi:hypothetical protein